EPALAQPGLVPAEHGRFRTPDELPGDAPVDQADGELERAGPVGAERVRALRQPGLEKTLQAREVGPVAGQPVRLGQHHQIEMAVDLPEELDVADEPLVAIVETLAEDERRDPTAFRVP